MSNGNSTSGTSSNGTNNTSNNSTSYPTYDDVPYPFSRRAAPCKFCNDILSPEVDPTGHWIVCSRSKRDELRATPDVYQETIDLAQSKSQPLKDAHGAPEIGPLGRAILFVLRGIEALGEDGYLATLEYLNSNVFTSAISNEILQAMVAVLAQKGDEVSSVLALESVLGYHGSAGVAQYGGATSDIETLSDWRIYEIRFLQNRYGVRNFDFIWQYYSTNWARVQHAARPGRTELALAVWLCKLKLAGGKLL